MLPPPPSLRPTVLIACAASCGAWEVEEDEEGVCGAELASLRCWEEGEGEAEEAEKEEEEEEG